MLWTVGLCGAVSRYQVKKMWVTVKVSILHCCGCYSAGERGSGLFSEEFTLISHVHGMKCIRKGVRFFSGVVCSCTSAYVALLMDWQGNALAFAQRHPG